MNYRGYKFKLSGVFKVENNKKLYSLEIYQGEKQIYKTDWIYTEEKSAFKDAKDMIKKNRFDTEIIRKNTNEENLKNDETYQNQKINRFSNKMIVLTIILMIISYSITAFGINELEENFTIFGIISVLFGILYSLIMLFWGAFANGEYELNNKQRKTYKIVWWINLLFNKGPFISYNDQPFKDSKKGWYSSTALIALILQFLFGVFIIGGSIITNSYGLVFYGTILSYILLLVNYVFSIIWEISDAKIKEEVFPFKRVITPILTIFTIGLFIYIYIKNFGIYN